MLVFTNRTMNAAQDLSAFERSYTPADTRLGMSEVVKRPNGGWRLVNPKSTITDNQATDALKTVFGAGKPVLLYVHGNNNTPAKCIERCELLEQLYGVAVIGFSWPSEGYLSDGSGLPGVANTDDGDEDSLKAIKEKKDLKKPAIRSKIERYRQAKTNAQNSTEALSRFLRLVAAARLQVHRQPFSIAIHSLGAHFVQHALGVPGAIEAIGAAHNVAFVAACARANGHKHWLATVRPAGQVFVAYNKGDSVLLAASLVDSDAKLGTDPLGELLNDSMVRYVSFTNASTGLGGHRYFAREKMPKKHLEVFRRMFQSERDIATNEHPREVYPLGCDADGLTCYMHRPDADPSGPN